MTSFMQPQMTSQQWWFYFETKSEGTTWVPAEWFNPDSLAKELGDDLVGSIGVTAGWLLATWIAPLGMSTAMRTMRKQLLMSWLLRTEKQKRRQKTAVKALLPVHDMRR